MGDPGLAEDADERSPGMHAEFVVAQGDRVADNPQAAENPSGKYGLTSLVPIASTSFAPSRPLVISVVPSARRREHYRGLWPGKKSQRVAPVAAY